MERVRKAEKSKGERKSGRRKAERLHSMSDGQAWGTYTHTKSELCVCALSAWLCGGG